MHEDLVVPYHQQDTDYYCGAACAQMVLRASGLPLLAQDGLYNDNHGHSVESGAWATPPDGLCWTMNNRLPAKRFALDSTDAEDPLSRTICWSIHRYQCAPIALVYGGNHWLVVRGYSASAAPAGMHDVSYAIDGFDLNNPWPPVPSPPGPPPHADGDSCGGGGNRGFADVNVSYHSWQFDYLTRNAFGAQWLGRFVAVCDPDPTDEPVPSPTPPAAHVWRPRFDGRRPLGADTVRADLRANLADAGLASHPTWSRVFDDVRTAEPLLVERLDRADAPYWIVPTVDARGRPRAAVGIDARYGNYEQALSVRDPDAALFGFADAERARERVLGGTIELPRGAGRLALRAQDLAAHPALVWKPCRQSLSPFDPFRVFRAGAHTLYVRASDGAVFTELTRDLGGL
jgi:hypothetical protein